MYFLLKRVTFFSCAIFLTLVPLWAESSKYFEKLDKIGELEAYKLKSNGLTVLLLPNDVLPVAAVMVTYNVGGRNEVAGTTGATHILEHMMFKGTKNRGGASGYSEIMEQIGARSNATTYYDRTNYYAVLPCEHVALAIELEADRMRNLRIQEDDLESELTVVRNEYQRGENNPVRTLIKEMYATAFMAHPYGQPVIGWSSDIENTNVEKLKQFYDTYYWPENATLTIIGGFDKQATLASIQQSYGNIPCAAKPIPVIETVEPEQLGPRRLCIERAGEVGVVAIGFKVPSGTDRDWAALKLIEQILGAKKSGRLYRALDDKGFARDSFVFAPQLRDPSLFFVGAYLTKETSHQTAEENIIGALSTLTKTGVTEQELARAKAVIKAQTVYERDGPFAIASEINEYIAMGDWASYITLPELIQNVSAESVQQVAAKYLVKKSSTTAWYVPDNSIESAVANSGLLQPNFYRDPDFHKAINDIEASASTQNQQTNSREVSNLSVDFSSHIKTKRIGPIELVAIDMPIDDVVSFIGSFATGQAYYSSVHPSVATLCAEMLDQGTSKNDRFTIAEWLDTLGASIRFEADPHSLIFSGRFLRKDAGAVFKLLAEQLREPAFDTAALQLLKRRKNANLLQAKHDLGYQTKSQISRILYPKEHPNYAHSIDSLINAINISSAEELKKYHAKYYGTKSMRLVFAGDIDFQQLSAAVEEAFGSWNGGIDYVTQYPLPKPTEGDIERLKIPDKTSVSVLLGEYTGLRRTHADYIPFSVGNFILGGSFHSRLMTKVRKEQGLSYHIGTSHQGDILTPGHWSLNATFAPSNLEEGLKSIDSIIHEWHSYGVTDKEIQGAIKTLSGSYLVRLSTTRAVAHQVHSFLQRGLDANYIDRYPEELSKISTTQVNRAIREYFNPDDCAIVAAGTITETVPLDGESKGQVIRVNVDAPDVGWRIEIVDVYRKNDELLVISQLARDSSPSMHEISTISDAISLTSLTAPLKEKHYIIGKTWDWGESKEQTFIKTLDQIDVDLRSLEKIFSKEPDTSALPNT